MRSAVCIIIGLLSGLAMTASAQVDDVCREYGETPTREIGRGNRFVPYVYGRVKVVGIRADAKQPRVIVIYADTLQPSTRQLVSKSGNFCFRKAGNGGTLIVEVDGVEAARKSVSDIGATRQREDFEVYPQQSQSTAPPEVVSSRFARPPNEKTHDLYKKTAEAESNKHLDKAVEYVQQIVAIDPEDFVAWAKLGSLYLANNAISNAEESFKRSIAVRADYSPALLNLGILSAVRKEFPAAIELFQRAIAADPSSARGYRLLGEAYLQNRQGTLGLANLDKALELDPIGMAECHLLKARLYDLAGARNLAANEYKQFLAKVPDHPDKRKFEKYIKENP